MIVVVGGIKGGSGKTTIAMNLCIMRSKLGRKVLLIDTDEQRSSTMWSNIRKKKGIATPWVTIQLYDDEVIQEIPKLKNDYDDIIIDAGGKNSKSQRGALLLANYFVTPFQPRAIDTWTINQLKEIISDIRTINPKIECMAIINRADSVGKDNEQAMAVLGTCPNLNVLPFVMSQRKIFGNAANEGKGISEMKPKDVKSISEMQMLYDVIYENDIKNIAKPCISNGIMNPKC